MGRDERGTVAITDGATRQGSLVCDVDADVAFAPIEPLSDAALGHHGLAVLRPRGLLRTEAVLSRAARALALLDEQPAFLAFDVTRDDLLRPTTAESLLHEISMAGRSATSCLIQVPHHGLALADGAATDNLRRFRAAGARLFLHEVSSRRHLSLVERFPLDGLSLASSVTAPGRDPRLLDAVIAAARQAGRSTLAIADGRHRQALAASGVDHLQHTPAH